MSKITYLCINTKQHTIQLIMSYDLHWNPKHPGHIVYMLDLSGSMAREINNKRLVDTVMEVINELFRALKNEIMDDDDILDLFSTTVIGYNSDVFTLIKCKNSEEFNKFLHEARRRGYIFNTQAGGEAEPKWQTYMADAFDAAAKDINLWLSKQRTNGVQTPAPVVINITDGDPYEGKEFTYAKALAAANRLKAISTSDGNVVVYNIHFSPDTTAPKMILPDRAPTNITSKFLFEASSVIPPSLVKTAQNVADWKGHHITSNSRAMISNETRTKSLLMFISWGTSTGGVTTDAIRQLEPEKPRK